MHLKKNIAKLLNTFEVKISAIEGFWAELSLLFRLFLSQNIMC